VKDKEEQLRKARVDQEQIKALQGEVTKWRHLSAQKDQDISYLARAKDELNRALSEERKLLFEVMQEMDTRLSDLNSSSTRERASKLFQSHI
jgi:predicted  nucleic acid-binding Zn-ribbon protein